MPKATKIYKVLFSTIHVRLSAIYIKYVRIIFKISRKRMKISDISTSTNLEPTSHLHKAYYHSKARYYGTFGSCNVTAAVLNQWRFSNFKPSDKKTVVVRLWISTVFLVFARQRIAFLAKKETAKKCDLFESHLH